MHHNNEIEELVDGRSKPFEVSTMSADKIEELVDIRPEPFEEP